jgi:phospholipid transport system substrate-binding protein
MSVSLLDELNRSVSKATKRILPARSIAATLFFVLCHLLLPTGSRADSPTEQVRTTVDQVLAIVRSSNPKSKAQMEAQRAQLLEVISPRFDFPEMAKRSLGRHWAGRSAEEQREFVKILAALLGRSYADNIESYAGQNVFYTREREEQNYAEVETKIASENRPPVSINYKLHSVDNQWKVYDLVIEDISVINNYRSQFDRVIAKSSYVDLVRILREKQS